MFIDEEDDEESSRRKRSQSFSDVEHKPLLGRGAGTSQDADYTNLRSFLGPAALSSAKKPDADPKPGTRARRRAARTPCGSPFSSPHQPTASPFSSPRMNMLLESPVSARPNPKNAHSNDDDDEVVGNNTPTKEKGNFLLYMIYASVNIIIAVPGLYGYAAVIFNHPIFQPHMNALAKLVLFSSLVHQLGFCLFSSLDFAIGTVQDAGLIFLSSMANTIANEMLAKEKSSEAIVSTTLVLLSAGTALLGLILVVIGKLGMANAVSYLPMPVIGGYLAFIGYFCIQAGVALCISQPLISFMDWKYLFRSDNFVLALPGLMAGMVLTGVSRLATSQSILPTCMVLIPALFYLILFFMGWTLEEAREGGWVGAVAPPTPVKDVWELVDFSLVEWALVGDILWTWAGMVFVVSFASCLDVAAISIDMGEALDTNRELATVGICNFMSGLSFGFTGSYIFSQTIFTYRTGVHSRWIGVMIMAIYLYFVVSPLNLLEISPLFFLGSTLIFIGYDLIYEWLYEIRVRVLWSEYATVWGTFLAIQVVGVDAGILVGVLFAIVEHVVANAQSTSVHLVRKRSRAIWTKEEYEFLQKRAYNLQAPKIVTIEVVGPVFFGSSLSLLGRLQQEVALAGEPSDQTEQDRNTAPINQSDNFRSISHTSSFLLTNGEKKHTLFKHHTYSLMPVQPPLFCVLDLTQVSNMDASAARSCFLQFCKLCNKRGMTVCASGSTPRIAWMLRSHGAAYPEGDEEERVRARLQAMDRMGSTVAPTDKILLFMTTHEALEFCEASLIHQFHINPVSIRSGDSALSLVDKGDGSIGSQREEQVSTVLAKFLSCSPEEAELFRGFDDQRYHEEIEFLSGEKICTKESRPEAFYVVLKGAAASGLVRSHAVYRHRQKIVSGAGLVTSGSASSLFPDQGSSSAVAPPPAMGTMWPVGGLFGYSDLLLDRPRTFGAFAAQNNTRVARITRSHMNLLQQEDPTLHALLLRVLLRASLLDLANCTCDDV